MKKYRFALFIGVLLLLIVVFIWGNSCLSSDVSSAQSGAVMRFLKPLLDPKESISEETFHLHVRKAAHFAEFAMLGFLVGAFFTNMEKLYQKKYLSMPIFVVLLVAVLDEYIQLHSDRGSMVTDVLLDFCGALTGLGFWALLLFFCKQIKNRWMAEK